MKPYYQDNHNTIYCLDFRKNDLADESVQCVVTSPPYWGLRKYSGEQELIWGNNHCEHQWETIVRLARHDEETKSEKQLSNAGAAMPINDAKIVSGFCSLCGAWKGAYGLEPTPEMYVEHTIEILREIRRVLRKDGVVFWNIGDSYVSGRARWSSTPQTISGKKNRGEPVDGNRPDQIGHPYLKDKDLCLIPFRVALEAQRDGWWVRSVIIWSKPNPMPESVTDRPTESHEYILMLTKSKKYYWDADAVREPHTSLEWADFPSRKKRIGDGNFPQGDRFNTFGNTSGWNPAGRNIRSVWEFPTQPYPEAHFAVFPEKLPELCIKATTPEAGCCSKCGTPWERMIEKQTIGQGITINGLENLGRGNDRVALRELSRAGDVATKTLGWQPTCKCNADKVPSIVLDPFMGAGTTLWVAKKLNRQAAGYEISEEYCQLAADRCRQQVLI